MKTNYINPFEKRTFSARFKAVFAFIKQNFVQVMKFYLPIFAAIAALVSWFETAYPDSSLNNLGSLINFVAFAYFAHYVANQGDVRTVSFKDMLKSVVSALGRVFVASLLPIGLAILFVLVFLIYFFAMMLIVGGGFDNVSLAFIVFVLLPILVFVLYVTPIFSIYYIHFYFSYSFKDSYDALEESFRLVKGHWWSTMGFMVLFEILQLIVLLPVILFLQEKAAFIGGWIGNLLIFIVSFFTIHVVALYQYGHLKALREEQGAEKTKIITAKDIVTAIVILLISLVGASNAERMTSALLNFAAMSGNSNIQNEVGRKCLREKDYEEAFDWFMKAADGGNAAAQYNLGLCYRNGWGVASDSLESFNWFMKAAEGGNASAQYKLGLCYLDGKGVSQDSLECFNWINKAAVQGHVAALNQLAYCYAEGIGTDADMSMAHATIDKAIQIEPDEANLYDSKGEFYMMAGDKENALKMYEEVIGMDSTFYVDVQGSKLYHYINN